MVADKLPPAKARRRAPRLVPFLITGAVLGFIAGALLALRQTDGIDALAQRASMYAQSTQVSYLGAFGALIGGLLAGVVYVLLDRRS
ncbi:MAG: hypothetical protein IPL45_12030 [Actinomycetales bacterium]|nr:hypothetical protein [Actinomycetales bacterium]